MEDVSTGKLLGLHVHVSLFNFSLSVPSLVMFLLLGSVATD